MSQILGSFLVLTVLAPVAGAVITILTVAMLYTITNMIKCTKMSIFYSMTKWEYFILFPTVSVTIEDDCITYTFLIFRYKITERLYYNGDK